MGQFGSVIKGQSGSEQYHPASDLHVGDRETARNLYAGTVGGPHLHFEIRYYRPDDTGEETFYGGAGPLGGPTLTDPSAGP